MIVSKEVGIALGAAAAVLLVGGVAYAASGTPAAATSSSSGTLTFTAGHRYEVDLVIPPNSIGAGDMPSATQVQKNLDAIATAATAFKVVSVGVTLSSTTSVTGGFTFWMLVDAIKTVTVSQADLLSGSPTGTTITATDEGLSSSSTAPVSTSQGGASYDAANAIPIPIGTSPTIPVGSSFYITPPGTAAWATPEGPTSDNYVVLARSGVAEFVATSVGKATITGSYVAYAGSSQVQTDSAVVTVVAKGTGAINAGGSTSSSGSAGASSSSGSAPASTAVTGAPSGLASPGPPATTGWTTKVVLGPNDVTVSAWPGDTISIALPDGATWASSGSSNGFPTSGSDPFVGTYSGPSVVILAWTLGGKTRSTTLTFATGRSWGSTSAFLLRYSTVRISLSADDYNSLEAAMQSNQAENAAIVAAEMALAKAGVNVSTATPAELFRMVLLAGGPFDKPLAINVDTLKTWAVANPLGTSYPASASPVDGTPLPSDWPSDSMGVFRAEFQYTGDGLTLSTLPYTLSGWVRLT
jgi:hypothetical protein